MTAELSPFEDRDVLQVGIEVTNAGDGLSKALGIEPEEMHIGETRYVLLECEVAKVRHDPVPKTDALRRVHVLRAGGATMLDAEIAKPAIDRMAALISEAEAAGKGQVPMPTLSVEEQALRGDHTLGEHKELEPGCPLCDEEVALAEAEDA